MPIRLKVMLRRRASFRESLGENLTLSQCFVKVSIIHQSSSTDSTLMCSSGCEVGATMRQKQRLSVSVHSRVSNEPNDVNNFQVVLDGGVDITWYVSLLSQTRNFA